MKRKRKKPQKPLTEQQKQAAKILFDTGKIGDTAAAVGVHRSTLWRGRSTRQFQREYERVHDRWVSETRRKYRREWLNSPEHKKELAARRRLKIAEKKLEEAGNSGDMNAYRKACAEYDRCMDQAFGRVLRAFDSYFSSRNSSAPKKRPEPKKYIVEIID